MQFNYDWCFNDYPKTKNGLKVFGTFLRGGGSTMGYKLAGYEHLGGVEIDPKIAKIYATNHHPKYLYIEDLRNFNKRTDLPQELYDLDILDGSPPCTTFSTNGKREKTWNKKKKFAEGQKEQILDDLVYVYCDTIKKLQPKVCILENVKGLVMGNAKIYSKNIIDLLNMAGYDVQLFLLNAETMGVPQTRSRVFFIGRRKDLHIPKICFDFNDKPILFGDIIDRSYTTNNLTKYEYESWCNRLPIDRSISDIRKRIYHKLSGISNGLLKSDKVARCLTTSFDILYDIPRKLNMKELLKISTFPRDYNFMESNVNFIMGMSVPPVMMARISYEIGRQCFGMS